MKAIIYIVILISTFAAGRYLVKPSKCGAFCEKQILSVSASEFNNKLSGQDVVVIDVRTTEEYLAGHIAGSVNSDFYNKEKFTKFLNSLDKNKEYMVYCRSGNRSGQALKMMEEKGFNFVTNLDGGVLGWQSENLPLERY
jgi:rhodanese-related sulfurtransferase